MDWTRPVAARRPSVVESVFSRIPKWVDWETAITLFLVLGAVTAVTVPLEDNGWSRNMPPLTTVGVTSTLVGMLLARSRLSAFVAWPLTVLTGAGVVFWQTLVMVGPGTLEQRLDAIYTRFNAWFDVAFSNNVTHDSLPFNVLIISITWLGVAMFSWSVYRWHNAWLGVIPGGIALFLDLILVGDNLTGSIILYMLFGFLLVMQTNLLALLRKWRIEGAQYPPLINLTFINFTVFALIGLISAAWIMPSGPFSTPAPVQRGIDETLKFGTDFVRLAGPLRSNKVIPIHSYSGVLPFQGSISLGDRDLLAVTSTDPRIQGPFLLRGSVYDQYGGGGWTTGARREVALPPGTGSVGQVRTDLLEGNANGMVIPLHIELTAKSVVGTIVFTPGETLTVSRQLTAEIPEGTVTRAHPVLPSDGRFMTDTEVLAALDQSLIGLAVQRNIYGSVDYVDVAVLDQYGTLDEVVSLDPGERIRRHRSYDVTAFLPTIDPEALRAAGADYPDWVEGQYLQLPEGLPMRIHARGLELQGRANATNAYDTAKAIEVFLRQLPVDYDIADVPADRDPVDYFLFDLQRGYFDYHASAMVVMLRQLGVPSRLAVGFAVGTDDVDENGAYVVRDKDSFAWPEVYFPNHGWVPFNPTPSRPEVITPVRRETGLRPDEVAEIKDGESIFDQVPASVDGAFIPPEGVDIGNGVPTGSAAFDDADGTTSPWLLSAFSIFIAMILGSLFLGWQRSVAGLPFPEQLWEKTVRLASWGGMPPEPGQTPHDYAKRLGKRFRAVDEFPSLADSYTRSRFGHKVVGAQEEDYLRDAWHDMRAALIGGIFSRPFRRWRKR